MMEDHVDDVLEVEQRLDDLALVGQRRALEAVDRTALLVAVRHRIDEGLETALALVTRLHRLITAQPRVSAASPVKGWDPLGLAQRAGNGARSPVTSLRRA